MNPESNKQFTPSTAPHGALSFKPFLQLSFTSLIIIVLGLLFIVGSYIALTSPTRVIFPPFVQKEETKNNPFSQITLSARAAYVWDIKNQVVLFENNADQELPLASLTKVMTAVTALDLLPDYTIITINGEDLQEEGDSGLYGNERWRLEDLLDYSLVVSSNDGTRAIAGVAGSIIATSSSDARKEDEFIKKMNEKAGELGLFHTRFFNANGLDINGEIAGAHGSARDVAVLFEYILKKYPEIIDGTRKEKISVTSLSNITHEGVNTNTKIADIPGILGSKTGFTDLSGGNLVVAYNPSLNRPIIISVLGSTYDGRFEDVLALIAAVNEYFATE